MAENSVNTIDYEKIYDSNNYGQFKFLEEIAPYEYTNSKGYKQRERMAKIQFVSTGTIMNVRVRDAIRGEIKDPYYPSILGIACIGNCISTGNNRHFYIKWKNMLEEYLAIGDTDKFDINPRWFCFEYFIQDIPYIHGYKEMINDLKMGANNTYSLEVIPSKVGDVIKTYYSAENCYFKVFSSNRKAVNYQKQDTASTPYYGISLDGGKYRVDNSVRTPYGPVGMFTDPIAAVNMREWYRHTYAPNTAANTNYTKMPLNECLKYKSYRKKPVQMYHLIDKDSK